MAINKGKKYNLKQTIFLTFLPYFFKISLKSLKIKFA